MKKNILGIMVLLGSFSLFALEVQMINATLKSNFEDGISIPYLRNNIPDFKFKMYPIWVDTQSSETIYNMESGKERKVENYFVEYKLNDNLKKIINEVGRKAFRDLLKSEFQFEHVSGENDLIEDDVSPFHIPRSGFQPPDLIVKAIEMDGNSADDTINLPRVTFKEILEKIISKKLATDNYENIILKKENSIFSYKLKVNVDKNLEHLIESILMSEEKLVSFLKEQRKCYFVVRNKWTWGRRSFKRNLKEYKNNKDLKIEMNYFLVKEPRGIELNNDFDFLYSEALRSISLDSSYPTAHLKEIRIFTSKLLRLSPILLKKGIVKLDFEDLAKLSPYKSTGLGVRLVAREKVKSEDLMNLIKEDQNIKEQCKSYDVLSISRN